ncbi:hypothetical protein GGU10DRAFT_139192 [Lentinula aff. detonsa]|uniref:Uncharacterized protein n=1 Tax=Lentinula aff. detonsa TaxID=2804958 RepID=A0AA38NBD1_9AGAR|nr:hypothetical protein GGU10DRAFT_139192 [Lentinula aff. detonsa]
MVISSRRKSIGAVPEGRVIKPRKKRAYSSFGTSKLSPLARSRLSIGNVKGILKSRLSIASSSQSSNSPASQQSRPHSQSFADEPTGAVESMDLTHDSQVPIHDNHARKSLGHRVGFRRKVHVRYFESDDTGSSAASQKVLNSPASQQSRPQSQSFADEITGVVESMDLTHDSQVPIHDNHAPTSLGNRVGFRKNVHVRYFEGDDTGSSAASQKFQGKSGEAPPSDNNPPAPFSKDENAYPGADRRRSSIPKSIAASEDMDMTSTNAGAILLDEVDNSALLDE